MTRHCQARCLTITGESIHNASGEILFSPFFGKLQGEYLKIKLRHFLIPFRAIRLARYSQVRELVGGLSCYWLDSVSKDFCRVGDRTYEEGAAVSYGRFSCRFSLTLNSAFNIFDIPQSEFSSKGASRFWSRP